MTLTTWWEAGEPYGAYGSCKKTQTADRDELTRPQMRVRRSRLRCNTDEPETFDWNSHRTSMTDRHLATVHQNQRHGSRPAITRRIEIVVIMVWNSPLTVVGM